MIALAAGLVTLLVIALLSARLFAGPTIYDRVLAGHAIVLAAALFGAACAAAARQQTWLDVSIVLILMDLPIVVVSLKFLRYRTLQTPLARSLAQEGAIQSPRSEHGS
jgi:multicomponent Na+:H+ antiporter subunit F